MIGDFKLDIKIVTEYDGDSVLRILEKTLIQYNILQSGMFGFIGQVNRSNNSFWIVNHSNIYKSRSGFRFKTYRRFEGHVKETLHSTLVEGEFKIRPMFKIFLCLYTGFISLFSILGLVFSHSITLTLQIILFAALMLFVLWGLVKFNISKTEAAEREILEFINDVLCKETELNKCKKKANFVLKS